MSKKEQRPTVRQEIETIVSSEDREISSLLPKDRVPLGFFCPYVPEELLHAAGAHPFRLMGTSLQITHANAHLPPCCCHLARSSFERFLRGDLDFLKGVIFSHTCDTMQGLSDLWEHQGSPLLHFTLMVPANLTSEYALPYFRAEMERFKNFLENHLGKISPQMLKSSIRLFNRIREKQKELYDRRSRQQGDFPGAYFARIIRAGYLLERASYLELLTERLGALPRDEEGRSGLVPIYLTGNMVHSESYLSLIEEAGGFVVQDDLCSGARTFRFMVLEDLDPMEGLTERLFRSFFCPTKHMGVRTRAETLAVEVERSGAKGVIFLLYRYCESHFFDLPDLKFVLESRGIPTLLLEVEDPSQSREQLRTRIQAFVEMLSPF